MNTDTGKIITQDALDQLNEQEKSRYVPLSEAQAVKYSKLPPSRRMGQYRKDQQAHTKKQIEKRRAANKRKRK